MPLLDETVQGVFAIAATPFTENGSLDLPSITRMLDFYIGHGVDGLTVLGMMGEAGKLSADEALSVVRQVLRGTDMPVVVGVSASGLAAIQALAAAAMDLGAAGVMVAPPHTLRSDAQIVSYFHDVAETLGPIPFVLQDFPLATQVVIPVSAMLQIMADCPTCVMLKHEDWPGLDKITGLREASDRGARRISILCGNGGLFLPEEMARGADGAMTGFAFPEMMVDVIAAHRAGNLDRARDVFDAYLPLIRYETQPGLGLAVRKYVLAQRGAIAHPTVRRPGRTLAGPALAEVEHLLKRQARRLAELGAQGDSH